jgi:thiol-disulfide isomerase/thioredoxin
MVALLLLLVLSADPAAATAIPLLDLDGRPAGSTADFRGETVVVNFWATWCKPCQMELPALQRIAGERTGRKVRILTVNLDATGETARKYMARKKMELPVFRVAPEVVKALQVQAVPVNIVLGPDGAEAARWAGYTADFERKVNALLDSFQGGNP